MYDPYSEPNYNPGGGASPQQGQGNQAPQFNMPSFEFSGGPSFDFKKYIPLAVIIIIVLIVGYLAFSWITSQQTVTIKLLDSDLNPVSGGIILKDAQSKPIINYSPKGIAQTFTATLFPGDYFISVNAEGYSTVNSEKCTITKENAICSITVQRDLQAILTASLEGDFTEIYAGQTLSGTVQVVNKGTEFNTEDIVPIDTSFFDVKMVPSAITTLNQGGSVFIDFNAKVKDSVTLTKLTNSNLSFKIKGSKVTSNKIALSAIPAVKATEVTVTGTVSSTSLTAGDEKAFTITIKNTNKNFVLKNVEIELIPDADSTQKVGWIKFGGTPSSVPNKTIIDSIDPTKSATVTIYITPPITEKIDSELKGVLTINSYSINGEKAPLIVNLKVSKEKKVSLTLVGVSSPFTIQCKKDTGLCTARSLSNSEVYFSNSGDVDISSITINIDYKSPSTPNCNQYLTGVQTLNSANTKKINTIPAKGKEPLIVDMTAPSDAPDKDMARCLLTWVYLDPVSPTPQTLTDSAIIEINKSES
ncbi:MAG: hypothetical protein WC652_01175 [archaeon]